MEDCSSYLDYIEESSVEKFTELNDLVKNLSDESVSILGTIFSIERNNIDSQRSYFKNIILPKLYLNDKQILYSLLDLFNNLDLIQKQIKPKAFFNLNFLNSNFMNIQIKNNQTEDIYIPISAQNKSKTIYLQIIPDGLIFCPDFLIFENDVQVANNQIYLHSYIQLKNNKSKIKITLKN